MTIRYRCPSCGKPFDDRAQRDDHAKTHDRKIEPINEKAVKELLRADKVLEDSRKLLLEGLGIPPHILRGSTFAPRRHK